MSSGRGRSRTGVHTAIAAIAMTVGLGAAGSAGADEAAVEHKVEGIAADAVWHPADLTIQTGDSVRWTFPGGVHNVKSDSSNWTLSNGPPDFPQEDATFTFSAEGVYAFVCEAHPGMDGTITVQDAPVTPPPPPPASPPPPPPPPPPTATADTVKPTVRSVALKALRNAVRVRFTLSETATVTVRVKRRGSRKVLKSAQVQAPAGTRTVTLRSKRLTKGRYTVEIQARDTAGNRSSLATKRVSLRG